MSDNLPRQPRPESLEAKFKLMTLLPFDKRAKRKHLLVYGFVLDWFHSKYGDALASSRHVLAELNTRNPFGHELYMGDVHSALTDLVAWGYLTREKGAGRRASRYVPVWSKFDSVRNSTNATHQELSVRETPNMSVRETPNAIADSVRSFPNEDPSTGPGHKTEVRLDGQFDGAAAPPPTDGLGATAAVPPSVDGFDEFWKAWPRKHGLKKARAEWAKITTPTDEILSAARRWADHYGARRTELKWIPEPSNWLRDERWKEDLPLLRTERNEISEQVANSAPAPVEPDVVPAQSKLRPALTAEDFAILPDEQISGVVERVEDYTDDEDGAMMLSVWFRTSDGREVEHFMVYQSPDFSEQEGGQRELSALLDATGPIAEPSDLVGREVDLTINRSKFVSCSRRGDAWRAAA